MNDSVWLEAVLYYVYISRVDRVDTFLVLLNFAKGFLRAPFMSRLKIRPNLIALIFSKGQIVSITFIYISIDVISHTKLGTKARLICREKKNDPKKGFIPFFFFGPERPIV